MQAWRTWQLADLSIATASRAGEVHQLWGSDTSGKLATHTLHTALYGCTCGKHRPVDVSAWPCRLLLESHQASWTCRLHPSCLLCTWYQMLWHFFLQFPQAGRGGVPVTMNGLPGNAARGSVGSTVGGINIGAAGRPGMDRSGPVGVQIPQPAANAGMQRGGNNLNALFLNNQASILGLLCTSTLSVSFTAHIHNGGTDQEQRHTGTEHVTPCGRILSHLSCKASWEAHMRRLGKAGLWAAWAWVGRWVRWGLPWAWGLPQAAAMP